MAMIYTGEELAKLVANVEKYERRDMVANVERYLASYAHGVACVLYGLRRTGKTTMMLHAIANMSESDFQKTVFVVGEGDDTDDVFDIMDGFFRKGMENFFLDEATSLSRFVERCKPFADIFGLAGHMIFSGTDSLKFSVARSELFGRKLTLSTTRIPFAEQTRLMPGLTFSEYAKMGGILFDDSDRAPKSVSFDEILETYTFSSIAENIQHSLSSTSSIFFGELADICLYGEMSGVINFCAHHETHDMVLEVMGKEFKSADVAEFMSLMKNVFSCANPKEFGFDKLDLSLEHGKSMGILPIGERKVKLTRNLLFSVKNAFLDIGMLVPAERRTIENGQILRKTVYVFLQPGVRWGQIQRLTALVRALDRERRNIITEDVYRRLEERVHDKVMEEMLLLEAMEACAKECDVFKFSAGDLGEADVVIALRKERDEEEDDDTPLFQKQEYEGFCAFEVKRHAKLKSDDAKHLKNPAFISLLEAEYGPMLDCAVLCPVEEDSRWHRNIDRFVLELPMFVERMKEMARPSSSPTNGPR